MKPNYYNRIVSLLKKLKHMQPECSIGKHLSTAFDGIDMWGATDKELYELIEMYAAKYEYDVPHDNDVETIIRDGMNLSIDDNGEDD